MDGLLRTVYDSFLKETLARFASNTNQLQSFILDYVDDLSSFCAAFRDLVLELIATKEYTSTYVVLGVSARLYPLTVRLYQRGILFSRPVGYTVDLLQALETFDVRVYKTRGTEPAKDIGQLSHASRNAEEKYILEEVRAFTAYWMPDGLFQTLLGQDMYQNQAVSLIMLEYDEHCLDALHSVRELQELVKEQITREHILPQVPNFSVTAYGFNDDGDFAGHLHQVGNLTPLTRIENSRCGNKPINDKMTVQKSVPVI